MASGGKVTAWYEARPLSVVLTRRKGAKSPVSFARSRVSPSDWCASCLIRGRAPASRLMTARAVWSSSSTSSGLVTASQHSSTSDLMGSTPYFTSETCVKSPKFFSCPSLISRGVAAETRNERHVFDVLFEKQRLCELPRNSLDELLQDR